MKYTLTRLFLKTKIPLGYYILIIIVTLMVIPALFTFYSANINIHQEKIATLLISIIAIIIVMFSNLYTNKSDRDFLLDMPLKKRDILKAYYAYNFILMYVPIILLMLFSTLSINSGLIFFLISYNILLFFTCINMSIIYKYILRHGYFIPPLFFIFLILPEFINFKYSITSIFYGHIINGILILIILYILTLFYIIKNGNKFNLYYREEKIKNNIKPMNISESPLRALYMKNGFYINTLYAYRTFSNVKIHYIRTEIYKPIIIFSFIGIIYFILNIKLYNTFLILLIDLYIPFLPGLVYSMLISQWPVLLERPWLSFTSMNAYKYIKNLIISIILSVFIATCPMILFSGLLLIFHFNILYIMIFLYLLVMPSITAAIIIYSYMLIAPIQITDYDNIRNFASSGQNMERLIPFFILYISFTITFLLSIFLKNIIYISLFYLIIIIITFSILNSKRIINYMANKLINADLI